MPGEADRPRIVDPHEPLHGSHGGGHDISRGVGNGGATWPEANRAIGWSTAGGAPCCPQASTSNHRPPAASPQRWGSKPRRRDGHKQPHKPVRRGGDVRALEEEVLHCFICSGSKARWGRAALAVRRTPRVDTRNTSEPEDRPRGVPLYLIDTSLFGATYFATYIAGLWHFFCRPLALGVSPTMWASAHPCRSPCSSCGMSRAACAIPAWRTRSLATRLARAASRRH